MINEQKLSTGNVNECIFNFSFIIKKMLLLLFYLIHPNFFLVGKAFCVSNNYYELNSLFSLVVNFRIFSIIVFLVEISRFYGLRVSRVLDIYAVKDKFSLTFTTKCLFKQNGLKTPVILLVLGLIMMTFIGISIQRVVGDLE